MKDLSISSSFVQGLLFTGLAMVMISCSSPEKKSKVPRDVVRSIEDINIKVTKKELKNGLTVVLTENRKLPLFSFYSIVKIGSRNETPGITGASHFLEHMMFKGSKNYKHGDFEKIVAGNGGTYNAYTNKDVTVYHESLPIAALDQILRLEADRLFSLNIDKHFFEKERNVILEERKLRYENSARGQLFEEFFQESFKGTPYEAPVIGHVKDLKTVTDEQIKKYFETYYAPENIVISISGDFDTEDLFEKIEDYFGKVPRKENFKKFKAADDAVSEYRLRKDWGGDLNVKGESPLPMFVLSYPGYPEGSEKSYSLDILGSILGGGESSYLNQKFVYSRRPKLSSIYAGNYGMEKAGVFVLGGRLLKGQSLRSLKKSLKSELKRVCDRAITEREVQKIKNQYLVYFFSSIETNDGLAELTGKDEASYGNPIKYKSDLKTYLSINAEDVRKSCKDILVGVKPFFVTLWDKFKK